MPTEPELPVRIVQNDPPATAVTLEFSEKASMLEMESPAKPDSGGKSLFSESLAEDKHHYAEHYVIEHVLAHVEELFQTSADETLSPEQEKRRAQERKQVFQQLQAISKAMDDKHVLLDLPLVETDSIQDITLNMLQKLQTSGVLQQKQHDNAAQSVKASMAPDTANVPQFMKPAMAHRLAVPLIYADMRRQDSTVPETVCVFARLHHATHVGEADREGIRFVFLILEHENAAGEPSTPSRTRRLGEKHVSEAEAIAFLMHDVQSYDDLLLAANAKDVKSAIQKYMEGHSAWEKGMAADGQVRLSQNEIGLTWEPSQLPFGGMRRDAKRRIFTKLWFQDWKDGFTAQSVAVVLYMFFACVAPAIAFGSLLDKATGGSPGEYCKTDPSCTGLNCECVGDIGVIEMILSSALCGIVYAIIGGSPLTILGGTGPVLIFTELLYKFSASIDVEFLPFYAWTGLWIGVMSVLLAAFDVAVIIKRVSRFTDEIFAGLISLIFTITSILDLVKIHSDSSDELCSDMNMPIANLSRANLISIVNEDDDATSLLPCMTLLQVEAKTLVSVVLAVGTYMIAMTLRSTRKSVFTAPWLRNFLADFGAAFFPPVLR